MSNRFEILADDDEDEFEVLDANTIKIGVDDVDGNSKELKSIPLQSGGHFVQRVDLSTGISLDGCDLGFSSEELQSCIKVINALGKSLFWCFRL